MAQIYLISPPKIDLKAFPILLNEALSTGLVPIFQLRLKGYTKAEIFQISQDLKEICHKNNCLFLLNDFLQIALDVGADGVHLGADDGSIALARKKAPQNFLIGASCYDSRELAIKSAQDGASYLSFGAFFQSKTKKSRGNPSPEIIKWCDESINLPVVAIGGITDKNCKELVDARVSFVSVISCVWDHHRGVKEAVINLHESLQN